MENISSATMILITDLFRFNLYIFHSLGFTRHSFIPAC
jgi:hypothetical protein